MTNISEPRLWENPLGLARAIGAVIFDILTGLLITFFFRKDDASRTAGQIYLPVLVTVGAAVMAMNVFIPTAPF